MRSVFCILACLCLPFMHLISEAETILPDSVFCENYSCCSSDDPSPAGVMISHVHKKKEWMISYAHMTMDMNENIQGIKGYDKSSVFKDYIYSADAMRMQMDMLMSMYGLSNRITLMGMFTYNRNAMKMSMYSTSLHNHSGSMGLSSTHTMETSGMGDMKWSLLYGLILKSNRQLIVSGGLSFPLGNIAIKSEEDPLANQPYSMQMGSGTYDFLPCINYLFQQGHFSYSTQVSSVIRFGKNQFDYRYGNEYSANVWMAWQWHSFFSSSLRLDGVLIDRMHGKDISLYPFNDIASHDANYGSKKMHVYLGSVIRFKNTSLRKFRLGLEYGIPVYQNANGIQMKSKQVLTVSLAYLI